MRYNTQQLLFNKSKKVLDFQGGNDHPAADFYKKGFILFENIASPEEAQLFAEKFLGNLDSSRLPLLKNILSRIQLAKADAIPVCDDSVETSFQALHFDMGQPIVAVDDDPQLMISAIALYHPHDTPSGDAETRVLPLRGLFARAGHTNKDAAESKIVDYVRRYGDGWGDTNTGRISCFARVADAVAETHDLESYYDKTMAQWFEDKSGPDGYNRLAVEHKFYSARGFDVARVEERIKLKPGQMLLVDNTRAAHGRVGKRQTKEIYQFMFGLKDAQPTDICLLRDQLVTEMVKI